MPAVTKNLFIEQGATFHLGFSWYNESEPPTIPPTAGLPRDITGSTVRMQVRKSQKETPILVNASSTNGKIIIDGPEGRIDLILTDEDTDMMIYQSSIYDMEIVEADGFVTRLLQGNILVSPNVTQEIDDPVVT